MKHPKNRIAAESQNTDGVEGYVFDGADGSQVAFWECPTEATTAEHIHAFDEYFLVVEGAYFLWLDGEERKVGPGQECFISKGTRIAGRVAAGTRTIHFFGAPRARRAASVDASLNGK